MLKLGRVTKDRALFLVLVFVFNFDLFKFSAAILEKGLFILTCYVALILQMKDSCSAANLTFRAHN